MNFVKNIFNIVEWVMLTFWGLTLIDLIPIFGLDFLSSIDATIKTMFALMGFIFFAITAPAKYKNWKFRNGIAREEYIKLKRENEETEREVKKEHINTVFESKDETKL